MKNLKDNVKIIAGTIVTTMVGTTLVLKGVESKQPELNNDVNENPVILKTERKETQSSYNKVKEINEDNVKLIVYESSEALYERILTTDEWINVSSKLTTNYSYNAVIDLSKAATVYEIRGITYVDIDLSKIQLGTVKIAEPTVKTDMNFFNQFKGKTIEENANQLIVLSYEHIDDIVNEQFDKNSDKIMKNTKEKIRGLYEGLDNVQVRFN